MSESSPEAWQVGLAVGGAIAALITGLGFKSGGSRRQDVKNNIQGLALGGAVSFMGQNALSKQNLDDFTQALKDHTLATREMATAVKDLSSKVDAFTDVTEQEAHDKTNSKLDQINSELAKLARGPLG